MVNGETQSVTSTTPSPPGGFGRGGEVEVRSIEDEARKSSRKAGDPSAKGSTFFGSGLQAQIGARRNQVLTLYRTASPSPFRQVFSGMEDVINDVLENRVVRRGAEGFEKAFLAVYPAEERSLFTMADVFNLVKAVLEGIRNPDSSALERHSPKDLIARQMKGALGDQLDALGPADQARAIVAIDTYAQRMVQKIQQDDVPQMGHKQAYFVYNAVGDIMAMHIRDGKVVAKDFIKPDGIAKTHNRVFDGEYHMAEATTNKKPQKNRPENTEDKYKRALDNQENKWQKKIDAERDHYQKKLDHSDGQLKKANGARDKLSEQINDIEKGFGKSEKKLEERLDKINDYFDSKPKPTAMDKILKDRMINRAMKDALGEMSTLTR